MSTTKQALLPSETPDVEECIRVAAYFMAEHRGFAPGRELDDWLAAEAMLRSACEESSTASAEESTATDTAVQNATGARRAGAGRTSGHRPSSRS